MKNLKKYIIQIFLLIGLISSFGVSYIYSQTLPGTVIDNIGKLQYQLLNGRPDSVFSNIVSVTVSGIKGFKLSKRAYPESAVYGDTIIYTILIEDTGYSTHSNLQVIDTVPPVLSVIKTSNGIVNGNIVSYTIGTLAGGQKDTLIITTRVVSELLAGTPIINYCSVTDSLGNTVRTSALVDVVNTPQIDLQKNVSKPTIQEGDTLAYTIHIRNTGDISLRNVTMKDTLPAELNFISVSPNAQFSDGIVTYFANLLSVGVADSVIINTSVKHGLPPNTVIRNIAYAHSQQTIMKSATSVIMSQTKYNILLTKNGPGKAFAGDTITYTINIQNNNNRSIINATVTDTLEPTVRFVNAGQNGVYDQNNHLVRWNFPVIDSLSSIYLTLRVAIRDTITRPTTILNIAGFSASNASDTSAYALTYVIMPPNLRIWKTVSPTQASLGDTIHYTINVSNIGITKTDDVIISDELPKEITFISSLPQGIYESNQHKLTWNLDSISVGQERQFKIVAVIKSDLTSGEYDFTNIAEVEWDGGRTNSSLDVASNARVNVLIPYIQVHKQSIKRVAEVGDIVPFIIRITNLSSNTTALNVKVIDDLPLGFTYVTGSSFIDSRKIVDPSGSRRLEWYITDSLKPNTTKELSYRLIVGAGALDGKGVNSAFATTLTPGGRQLSSNISSDKVEVKYGIFTKRGIVIGKVFYDDNGNLYQDEGEEGIKGVELITEDGTRVITGDDGKYSLPDVNPGEHVIRVREETLPPYSELVLGYGDFANKPNSRFVRVSESGIARADFYLNRTKPSELQIDYKIAKVGEISLQRITEPKNILYVIDEDLTPIQIKGTQFDVGKATLKPEAFPTLKAVADLAREYPEQIITIAGHTDSKPIKTKEFPDNQALSEARAKSVMNYLVEKENIDASRIRTYGYGETQPVATNATTEGRALNRRVEITLSPTEEVYGKDTKIVNFKVVIKNDASTPISEVSVIDKLDAELYYIPGSARFNGKNIEENPDGQYLTWTISNLLDNSSAVITYQAYINRPQKKSITLTSQSTLKYRVEEKEELVSDVAVTSNTVSTVIKPKPIKVVLSGVLFETGKADLKKEAENALKSAADLLKKYPQATASIEGHTDSRPIKTKEFPSNVALSNARAKSVADYLVENLGIDKSRLLTYGWGELKPIASNQTAEGRQSNRRVEILIDKQEETEEFIREGEIDSSQIIKQKIGESIESLNFDEIITGSIGGNFIIKVILTSQTDNNVQQKVIVDELPQTFKLLSGSQQIINGLDELKIDGNKLIGICSRTDNYHSFIYKIELIEQVKDIETIKHNCEVRRTLKNGKEILDKSSPIIINLKRRGDK